MEVCRFSSATDFLTATEQFRRNDPVRTGLITSIATSVANGARSYEGYFWWAAIKDNHVEGVAIRTLPFGYVLSPMAEEVVATLYSAISKEDPTAKEFAGPKKVIDYLQEISHAIISEDESELIYENRQLIPVSGIGHIRVGESEDFDFILNWMKEFIKETGLRSFNLENMVRNTLESERYSILMVENTPVCLGGNSEIQSFEDFSIGRVGPIYTPYEHRRKGYASALTSHITSKLHALGAVATLYTQAANPTSNKIYQEIGYTLVDENRRIVIS